MDCEALPDTDGQSSDVLPHIPVHASDEPAAVLPGSHPDGNSLPQSYYSNVFHFRNYGTPGNPQPALHPLPPQPVIDNYTYPTKVKVSNQQLVLYKGIQYSVDKQYAGEFVSLEEFNDILQIYYKGKLIQIHHISKNPINYMKEHYKQSLGKTIKEEEMEKVISNNLRIMDNILNTRQVTVTKEEASKSTNACIAYLLMRGHESNWIRYFLQTLSKEERIIFLNEISKLLPYVTDESQLFLAFKHGVKKENVKLARVDLWELDLMCCYSFLSQEGYDSIKSDFKEEVDYRLKTLKERWEG